MKSWAIGLVVLFGLSYGLISSTADFDGDSTDDIGIFRPSTGLWAVRGVTRIYFGGSEDNPVPGDYKGDGTDEIAINRPGNGLWAIRGVTRVYFGSLTDIPLGGEGGRWLPSGNNIYYNAGNIGIGTTNPVADLHVLGPGNENIMVESSGPWLAQVILANTITRWSLLNSIDGTLAFFNGGGGGTLMRLTMSGNLGIGTDLPTQKLHVAGQNPRILIESYSGNPEVNFNTQTTANPNNWAVYKDEVSGDLRFYNNGDKVALRYGSGGIGGSVMAKGGTSDPDFNINYAGIFARMESSGWIDIAQLFAMDGQGNTSQLSPHDPETGEWIFYSKNVKTGRVVRVNMEKLVHLVEKLSGEKLLEETFVDVEEGTGPCPN